MEWVEIENQVDESGLRRVHLMANTSFGLRPLPPNAKNTHLGEDADEWIDRYLVPSGAQIAVTKENGAFHLHGSWPYRGVLDVQPEGWPQFKRFVCWALKGERVSKGMTDAAVYYAQTFARWPERAFVREMVDGKLFVEHDGMILVEADWAPRGCVLVGG